MLNNPASLDSLLLTCSLSSNVSLYSVNYFVLFLSPYVDDGSSECCCWANAERAATFLRLHEKLPEKNAFGSHDWKFNTVNHNSCQTINYNLRRILKKHDRIVVKNFGPLYDSSYQDLAISVSSDKALSLSDENFLKSVVVNACVGTSWVIFCWWN